VAGATAARRPLRVEAYEWQIAALLATIKLDEPAKRRVVEALMGTAAPLDTRPFGRLEQELGPRTRQRLKACETLSETPRHTG